MKFVFGAGGTGGHIIPALALADELKARGHQSLFIGNADSLESRLCAQNSYPFASIKIHQLYRSFNPENLLFPFHLAGSVLKSLRILKHEAPDAVICTGGFVSGPVAIAASMLKLPLFFHESNSYPGLVTRFMERRIKTVFISFDSSRTYLTSGILKNLGIPLKQRNITDFSLQSIGLSEDKPTILVSGGSQGSLAINLAIEKALPTLLESGWQLIWQTGKTSYDRFAKYAQTPGVYLFAFSPDLPGMLSKATIAITRAGAMTIAELEETRTPAILIPLPTAAENHQFYNAKEQQDKGLAVMLEQSKLDTGSLLAAIQALSLVMDAFRARLQALPTNNAAMKIVGDILQQLNKRSVTGV